MFHSRGLVAGNSKQEWTGVPIIASNMDTTGTFEIANVFARYQLITAAAKHYSEEDWSRVPKEVSCEKCFY